MLCIVFTLAFDSSRIKGEGVYGWLFWLVVTPPFPSGLRIKSAMTVQGSLYPCACPHPVDSRLRGNDGPGPPCGYCLEASMTVLARPVDSRLRGNDGPGVGWLGFYVLKVLIVSSPRWLMILMAMRRDAGTGNGRDTSLLMVSQVSRFIWAFKVVLSDL